MSDKVRKEADWHELDKYCYGVMGRLVTAERVGRNHSYVEAASELGVTANAIRQRLDPLERFLGGPVIDAKNDHAPLGKALSRLWQSVRPPLEQFIDEIRVLKNQAELRLTTIESVWKAEGDWLEEEFRKTIAGGSLTVRYADSFLAIADQVRYGAADIGIASYPPDIRDILPPVRFLQWRREEMVLVTDPYLLENHHQPSITSDRIQGLHQTFFTLTDHSSMYRPVNDWLTAARLRFRYKPPLQTVAEITNEIGQGHGISILPRPAISKAFDAGLVDYYTLKPPLYRPVGLIYREDAIKKELQDAFIEVLKKHQVRPNQPVRDQAYFAQRPARFPN